MNGQGSTRGKICKKVFARDVVIIRIQRFQCSNRLQVKDIKILHGLYEDTDKKKRVWPINSRNMLLMKNRQFLPYISLWAGKITWILAWLNLTLMAIISVPVSFFHLSLYFWWVCNKAQRVLVTLHFCTNLVLKRNKSKLWCRYRL